MKSVSVSCAGSCGELFQGVYDDEEYLLSYNIDKKSIVTVSSSTTTSIILPKIQEIKDLVYPKDMFHITRKTSLPVGKGCSSSTADMISALYGMSLLKQEKLSMETLSSLCSKVEPTDSVAFKHWTVINPLTAKPLFETHWKPELYVYMLEPIETVNTVGLIRMSQSNVYDKQHSKELFTLFQKACQEKSLSLLSHVALESALLNDRRLPKPYLKDIIAFVKNYQLLGINIAHSGTVVGILLTKEQVAFLEQIEEALSKQLFAKYYQKRTLCTIIYEGVKQL
ncbi:kinase [Granulicatella sp. zg-ZJ]|uniref:GHMP family kinase ATP-binding protein n=1 Tax=unclassified Granulicatella TaxID=2630493 RepID=UPI0013BF8FC5|nr:MULTISPECIES: kinase [unclassified Granulicatella]MBS4750706.1 kinase [Carnobacteriaceae bacterium zg-ZUI78]NEW61879.1 kinase [Granulicatella sp. zg-ZJ]NEW65953.1 kinase [Granulicatella sp. zg-84]QMI85177.1 kinase [Carnobacteriaceae bacterium zg-84]